MIGGTLFILGENDDSPGLVAIGFLAAIGLFFLGLHNVASTTTRARIPSLVCWSLGGFGALLTIAMACDREFSDAPGVAVAIALISGGFLVVGARFWHRTPHRAR